MTEMAPDLPDSIRTPRGHDLTLLQELQELTPAERIARNCAMADWIEKLQAAAPGHAAGNGAMAETEAPASERKPPATATPSTYSHRARRRLYPFPPGLCPLPLPLGRSKSSAAPPRTCTGPPILEGGPSA